MTVPAGVPDEPTFVDGANGSRVLCQRTGVWPEGYTGPICSCGALWCRAVIHVATGVPAGVPDERPDVVVHGSTWIQQGGMFPPVPAGVPDVAADIETVRRALNWAPIGVALNAGITLDRLAVLAAAAGKTEAEVAARADAAEEKDGKEFWRERALAAEARAVAAEAALEWYAERRNHHDAKDRDSYDGNGPGARARAALAATGRGENA